VDVLGSDSDPYIVACSVESSGDPRHEQQSPRMGSADECPGEDVRLWFVWWSGGVTRWIHAGAAIMTSANENDVSWRNWSGRLKSRGELHHVRSEADAAAIAMTAARSGRTLRVAGAGHSHAPLVPNHDLIVDCSGLSGVISVDHELQRAWVRSGTPISALGEPLREVGLGLHNQGDIDGQAIAGAAATGTHGTGRKLQNFSASVVGARIALASGELVDCDEADQTDLWQVARLNLGAVGIVTRLELGVRDAYRLRERRTIRPFDDVVPELASLVDESRHYEFFWMPDHDVCVEKIIDETGDPPEYPVAAEGGRVGWNYEVLPSHRDWRHTEMEYSVPIEQGPACMAAIRQLIKAHFPDMPWAVEYRTLAADDVWMSTPYRRDTVTISLHQAVDEDEEPMFRAAEEVFLGYGGRPHWAKLNYLGGSELAVMHDRWEDWWSVRDTYDPDGVFLNDYMRSIRP